ncbi:hypothetical protein AB4184_07695, partial [Vibrio splendidus]|uniref:hypothetical protein n=1 Tax=Vibrio splendidus TaxID=29497 RepID=UPI001F534F02
YEGIRKMQALGVLRKVSMLNFVMGCVVGFSATILYVAFDLNYAFDSNITVNIVIASATLIATAIHYASVKKQDMERVWEINKKELLGLSQALSDIVQETEMALDYEWSSNSMSGPYIDPPSNPKAYKNFDEKVLYMLNVHKPLLPKSLVSSIVNLQKLDKKISRLVNEEDLDHKDAYEEMLKSYSNLRAELDGFIRKIAGV